jgi:hypothetical protein
MGAVIPLRSVALAMARHGFRVFPCLPDAKRPATRDGLKSATLDVDLVDRWWRANPRFNIGLATGQGLVVVDCDAGKPWPHSTPQPAGINDGADMLVTLAETYDAVADGSWMFGTWSVRTPSGGMHFYYRVPDDVVVPNSASRVGTWIDVRADGGYVVAPWSSLPSGGYTPVNGWDHVVDAALDGDQVVDPVLARLTGGPLDVPAWLLPLMLPKDPQPVRSAWDLLLARLDSPGGGDGSRYAATALAGELDRVRAAVTGTRNDTLNRAAYNLGQLVAAGLLDDQVVTGELTTAAAVCGLDPLRGTADDPVRHGERSAVPEGGDSRMSGRTCPTTGEPVALCNCADCEPVELPAGRALDLVPASGIAPRPVRWLLDRLIPLASVTLLAGREGLGKSTLWAYWAAAATHGTLDGHLTGTPTDVLVIANEDAYDYTLVPRLMAAGANLDRVRFVGAISADGQPSSVVLPLDAQRVRDAIVESGARLVIVDPLVSVLDGSLDSHKDHSIRQALDPINRLASTSGAAVIGLVHLNKGQGSDILDRVLGSRAFTAAARAVVALVEDPDDDTGTRRLVVQGKANLGPMGRDALVITVSTAVVETPEGDAEVGVVNVVGTRPIDLDDVLQHRDVEDGDDLSDTARWLLDYLVREGGQAARSDVIDAGRKAGHSLDQVKRARRRAGVVVHRTSTFPSVTTWLHPDNTPQSVQLAHSAQSVGTPDFPAPTASTQSAHPSVVPSPTAPTALTAPTVIPDPTPERTPA